MSVKRLLGLPGGSTKGREVSCCTGNGFTGNGFPQGGEHSEGGRTVCLVQLPLLSLVDKA